MRASHTNAGLHLPGRVLEADDGGIVSSRKTGARLCADLVGGKVRWHSIAWSQNTGDFMARGAAAGGGAY